LILAFFLKESFGNNKAEISLGTLLSELSPFDLRNGMKKRVWKLREEAFHVTHITGTVKHDVKINVGMF
jgi:hypothetical protein